MQSRYYAGWWCGVLVGVAVGTTAGSPALGQGSDLGVAVQAISPSDDSEWTSTGGVEAQWRLWLTEQAGIAFAAGMQVWDAGAEFVEGADEFGPYSHEIYGESALYAFGLSLLCRTDPSVPWTLTLEAGLRHAAVDSDIRVDAVYEDAEGTTIVSDVIETDDTVLGVLSAALDAAVGEQLVIGAGIGWQWDLLRPDEYLLGDSLGRTDFGGFTACLRAGVRF